jgi:hypothetical protein
VALDTGPVQVAEADSKQRPAGLADLGPHLSAHWRAHRENVAEHEFDDRPADHRPLGIGDSDRHLAVGLARENRSVAGPRGLEGDVGP